MSLQSPANLLRVIRRLTSPAGTTLDELMRLLDSTRRTVFYYLQLLRDNGFTILHRGDRYYISTDSEFISDLVNDVSFSESEAVYLYRLASGAERSPLSESVRAKLKLQNARIYMQAQNLFTITSYKGADPEGLGYPYALPRQFTLGVQIGF